jgi:hypothetical protein
VFCSSSSKRHIFIPARYKLPLVAHLVGPGVPTFVPRKIPAKQMIFRVIEVK